MEKWTPPKRAAWFPQLHSPSPHAGKVDYPVAGLSVVPSHKKQPKSSDVNGLPVRAARYPTCVQLPHKTWPRIPCPRCSARKSCFQNRHVLHRPKRAVSELNGLGDTSVPLNKLSAAVLFNPRRGYLNSFVTLSSVNPFVRI